MRYQYDNNTEQIDANTTQIRRKYNANTTQTRRKHDANTTQTRRKHDASTTQNTTQAREKLRDAVMKVQKNIHKTEKRGKGKFREMRLFGSKGWQNAERTTKKVASYMYLFQSSFFRVGSESPFHQGTSPNATTLGLIHLAPIFTELQ
ncbi:hypothetical protein POVCU1_014900 [Plasmodium ovale curtisi]|uniref:Uncharacterized protein n=1 Tax=Plasmodium ovale curtisi TaxID=864141 RepID=A0A1A8W6I5_PLAOA|nr:hypothetical protein POVCU1_014900 [Plasmodium ovale curtisi]